MVALGAAAMMYAVAWWLVQRRVPVPGLSDVWQLDEAHRIGIDAGFLTIDEARGHVTPRAVGGTDDERNLVAACRECKSRQGAS